LLGIESGWWSAEVVVIAGDKFGFRLRLQFSRLFEKFACHLAQFGHDNRLPGQGSERQAPPGQLPEIVGISHFAPSAGPIGSSRTDPSKSPEIQAADP
jgi:hypothetical protein